MKLPASILLLVMATAPVAVANSTSFLKPQAKQPQFTNYQLPSGGTAVLVETTGPRGNPLWDLSGQASGTLYTFTFDFSHTQSPTDFYAYSPLSLIGNGVNFRGTIIHAHLDGTGLLTAGWTGGSSHGRLTFQLLNTGTGCSTNPSAQCFAITSGTFAVARTPELGSLPLIVTGLVGIAGAMRRKIARVL